MKRRILLIVFAAVVLVGLVLFLGAFVRALTLGAIVLAVLWFGLVLPNRRGRGG
jgi:hypothetical protein